MVPYFVGASLIAAVSFYFNSYIIPDANKFRIGFELQYVKKAFYFSDRNIHIKIGPTQYMSMDRYNNRSDVGYTITLEIIEDGILKEKLHARTMKWDTTSHKWTMNSWQRRVINENSEIITNGLKMDTTINVSPSDFENKERDWETLTMPELNDHIALQTSRGAADVDIYKIEKYIRFMAPFSVIVLTFIGVIVSARKSRRGTGFQIALGFLIAFMYVIFFILSRALAEANTFNSPILAVWMPNILFAGVGVVLYRTVPR
jgi:lipopolysaccharide export system permease protein